MTPHNTPPSRATVKCNMGRNSKTRRKPKLDMRLRQIFTPR